MRTNHTITTTSKRTVSEYTGVLHCEEYDYEHFPDEIMQAPLSEPFCIRRRSIFNRPDGFIVYIKFGVDFEPTSELLYPNMKVRLGEIRAKPNFYMIIDNPSVSLGIVTCSLYTRRNCFRREISQKN